MKELPKGWILLPADNCFEQISITNNKVKTRDCLKAGQFPVVDQGQELIAGYVDDSQKVIKIESPVIIFGDHTKIIKCSTVISSNRKNLIYLTPSSMNSPKLSLLKK